MIRFIFAVGLIVALIVSVATSEPTVIQRTVSVTMTDGSVEGFVGNYFIRYKPGFVIVFTNSGSKAIFKTDDVKNINVKEEVIENRD